MAADAADRAFEIRERIRSNFDRAAGEYAGFEAERAFFQTLTGELLEGACSLEASRVLDVGCGTGASLQVLTERVGPAGLCVGLDISRGMLTEARARLGAETPLVLLDACAFDRAFQTTFHAVVYNAVLHILPDAGASLACARKLLEPAGTVHASYLHRTVAAAEGESLADLLRREGHAPGRHTVSPWEAVEEALDVLFEDVRLREVPVEMSPAEVLGFYGQGPMCSALLPKLPSPERRKVLEDLVARWEAEGKTITQVWKLASARKPRAPT